MTVCGALMVYADGRCFSDRKFLSECRAESAYTGRRLRRRAMQVEGDKAGPPTDGDRLTVAEIHDSIETISDADMARLVLAARGFSRLCRIDPEDLLQEAFTR